MVRNWRVMAVVTGHETRPILRGDVQAPTAQEALEAVLPDVEEMVTGAMAWVGLEGSLEYTVAILEPGFRAGDKAAAHRRVRTVMLLEDPLAA